MGSGGKDAVRKAENLAAGQLSEYKAQAQTAKASVEKQKQAYKGIDIVNPYADMQNQYAENVFEDLTVNQQQAQFEAQQGAQQRANIMQGLRGAAGASGVAGLAQAMASQGQLQSQQISASIGQQESQQQIARAQGAASIQQLERQGAAAVDLQQRQGEAMVMEAATGRASTLLGMQYGELAGARAGTQSAYGNVASANAMELERINANKAMVGEIVGGVASAAGSILAGPAGAASVGGKILDKIIT